MNPEKYELYHYYEHDSGPFMTLTALQMNEAKRVLIAQQVSGKFRHPDIDGFLKKRYARDKVLREMFIDRGGKPECTAPVYMMLGEHKQWESAYENPAVIKNPLTSLIRLQFHLHTAIRLPFWNHHFSEMRNIGIRFILKMKYCKSSIDMAFHHMWNMISNAGYTQQTKISIII